MGVLHKCWLFQHPGFAGVNRIIIHQIEKLNATEHFITLLAIETDTVSRWNHHAKNADW